MRREGSRIIIEPVATSGLAGPSSIKDLAEKGILVQALLPVSMPRHRILPFLLW